MTTPLHPETFLFSRVVALADADGKPIREGSVLREINDGSRGCVTDIIREGKVHDVPFATRGDIAIKTGAGTHRVTNRYSQWRHIPHNEQTYEERRLSWSYRLYQHDEEREASPDEGLAISGIMALLPDNVVDWDFGPWPDRLDDALKFLSDHLTKSAAK